jgi:hypothetical protein
MVLAGGVLRAAPCAAADCRRYQSRTGIKGVYNRYQYDKDKRRGFELYEAALQHNGATAAYRSAYDHLTTDTNVNGGPQPQRTRSGANLKTPQAACFAIPISCKAAKTVCYACAVS